MGTLQESSICVVMQRSFSEDVLHNVSVERRLSYLHMARLQTRIFPKHSVSVTPN
jgi:hypothetical protein